MGGFGAGRGTEQRLGGKSTPVRLLHESRPWPPSLKAFKCLNPIDFKENQGLKDCRSPRLPALSLDVGLAFAKWPKVEISQQSWPREFKQNDFFPSSTFFH